MEFLAGFLTVTAVAMLGVIAPGPDTAVIVKNSLLRSRKDGIATTLGVVFGNAIYVSLALLGLGAIIAGSVALFTLVKLCGALYLILLGIKLLFAPRATLAGASEAHERTSLAASFREGLFTTFSNPKFMLFLLALFTQVIDPSTPLSIQAIYAYQIPVIALAWFTSLSLMLTMPAVTARVANFMHLIERVTGLVFIALGAKVALSSNT